MKNEKFLDKIETYEVTCVLGKKIRTTKQYFAFITQFKHSELKGKLDKVLKTITEADEVRRNSEHLEIYLYYRKLNRHWICVVTRHLNGEGFVITTYITRKPKRKGEKIWPREK